MTPLVSLRALGAAALFLAGSAVPALADPTPSPTATPSPIPVIAHVVSSDRADESLANATRTTFVVTAGDIARNGYTTVSDALASVPGVTVNRVGAFGAMTALSIRGGTSAQALVLVDGLPIAGAQIGSIDLGQYATAGVERIEVVEGGGSTLYGSGSVGGIVNIITSHAAHTGASVSTGSFGERTLSLETPFLSFSRTYAANGYNLPDGTTRTNSDGALTSVRTGFTHHLGEITAAFSADLSDQHVGAPGSDTFFSATSRQFTVDRDVRITLSQQKARSTLSLQVGESAQHLLFTCDTPVDATCFNAPFPTPGGTPPPPAPPYAAFTDDQRAMASINDVVGDEHHRLIYGVDLARGDTRIDPGTLSDGTDPFSVYAYAQAAAYAQSQWGFANGNRFYAGLRAERDGAQGGAFSPSLGGAVHLSDALFVRANAATAFDAPSATLLYFPGFANPNLQPERLRVADVALVAPSVLGGMTLGWFSTAGSNLFISNPPNFIPENVGHASIEGVTLNARTRRERGVSASLNVTDLYRAQDLDAQVRLPGRGPVLQSTLGLDYAAPASTRFDGFGISATSKGAQGAVDPTRPLFDQPAAYTRVDAYLGYRVAPHAVLTVRARDLGNERYAEVGGFPLPGRSFTLELRTR